MAGRVNYGANNAGDFAPGASFSLPGNFAGKELGQVSHNPTHR
jgi:hypothetical protein